MLSGKHCSVIGEKEVAARRIRFSYQGLVLTLPGAVGLTQTNVREGQGKLRAPSSTTQGQVSRTEGKASSLTLQGVTQQAAGEFVPQTQIHPGLLLRLPNGVKTTLRLRVQCQLILLVEGT